MNATIIKQEVLCCPVCGFDSVHIGTVCVLQNNVATIVERCVDRVVEQKNGTRGSIVEIDFLCEAGHFFKQAFDFHKGTTTRRVIAADTDDGGQLFSELWRD